MVQFFRILPALWRVIADMRAALDLAGPDGRVVSHQEWREIMDSALDAAEVVLGSLFVDRIGDP